VVTVTLDFLADPSSADAIKWDFDGEGAFVKRFGSKSHSSTVQALKGKIAEGYRLQKINVIDVSGKNKDFIKNMFAGASEADALNLTFRAP
jgi:hypothetical protein